MQQVLEQPTQSTQPADDLDTVRAELARSRELLASARRERDLHRALFDAGAIDLDAVGALAAANANPDPAAAVAALKAAKPHLFRAAPAPRRIDPPRSSAMTGSPTDDRAAPITLAARRAADAGDRTSLLTYLRLKRAGALAAD